MNISTQDDKTEVVNNISKKVRKPESVISYNLLGKGVDKNNQLVSFYFANIRSVKWYKKLFFIFH